MSLSEAVDFVLISVVMLTEPRQPWRVGLVADFGAQHGWRGAANDLDQAIKFLEHARPPLLAIERRDTRWPAHGEADLRLTADGRLAAEERLKALLEPELPIDRAAVPEAKPPTYSDA